MRVVATAMVLVGCGRIGFDPPLLSLDAGQCPPGYTRHGTRCYRITLAPAEWLAAELACEADAVGAHLVVIDQAAEADVVDDAFDRDVWLGATDRVIEGDYREVTGRSMRWNDWDTGEPGGGTEDCASIASIAAPDLIDLPCTDTLAYVCEFDGEPVQPSTY